MAAKLSGLQWRAVEVDHVKHAHCGSSRCGMPMAESLTAIRSVNLDRIPNPKSRLRSRYHAVRTGFLMRGRELHEKRWISARGPSVFFGSDEVSTPAARPLRARTAAELLIAGHVLFHPPEGTGRCHERGLLPVSQLPVGHRQEERIEAFVSTVCKIHRACQRLDRIIPSARAVPGDADVFQ